MKSMPAILDGLSPLARGTPNRVEIKCSKSRFIPAGAGNTTPPQHRWGCCTVYPRWRGEHNVSIRISSPVFGLSPLARGTPVVFYLRLNFSRFIPAGAGNTFFFHFDSPIFPVYPRWRGEHPFSAGENVEIAGLSPLARGTHLHRMLRGSQQRFIPAGAGNTCRLASRTCNGSVYPRWRGEHVGGWICCRGCGGLSPLARGTPYWNFYASADLRFIPAGAGNTAV